jgi:hypothetical protein
MSSDVDLPTSSERETATTRAGNQARDENHMVRMERHLNKLQAERLAKTRERIARRKELRRVFPNRKTARLTIEVPADVYARAKVGCELTHAIDLSAYLKTMVEACAAVPGASAVGSDVTGLDRFPPQQREWAAMIEPYLEPIPPGESVGMTELLDMMDIPEGARGHSEAIMIGRIMKRLGWYRMLAWDAATKTRSWVYRRSPG